MIACVRALATIHINYELTHASKLYATLCIRINYYTFNVLVEISVFWRNNIFS